MNAHAEVAPSAARPLHERCWRPTDHVPPHMEAIPDLTPEIIRPDDARKLWAEVLAVTWRDAACAAQVGAEVFRYRAEMTAKTRREFIAFARDPLRRSDVAWMVTVLGFDLMEFAVAVERRVACSWEPIPRHDSWIHQLVDPNGDLLPLCHELPGSIGSVPQFQRWLDLGKPPVRVDDLPKLLKARSRDDYEAATAVTRQRS